MANRLRDTIKLVRSVKPHHAQTFAKTVVPEVVRPARIIWNQAIGAIFIILAVPAVFKILQVLREAEYDDHSIFVLVLSVIFSGVMIAFGVSSLLKARKIGSRP